MTKQELIKMAEAGEADAVKALMELSIQENNLSEAIEWAEKGAELGDCICMIKLSRLLEIRIKQSKTMGFWALILDDSQTIQRHMKKIRDLIKEGKVTIDDDLIANNDRLFRDAVYNEASAYYATDDNASVIRLLSTSTRTKEAYLYGMSLFNMGRDDEKAVSVLLHAFADNSYANASKDAFEEMVYLSAMHTIAAYERIHRNNLEKAVEILTQALRDIQNDANRDASAMLTKELSRYHKKMFGGWKYI